MIGVAAGQVYLVGSQGDALLWSSGGMIPLSLVGDAGILLSVGADVARAVVRDTLKDRLADDARREQDLRYFLDVLVPLALGRKADTGADAPLVIDTAELPKLVANPLALFARGHWLALYGRFWQLRRSRKLNRSRLALIAGSQTYTLTGACYCISEVWRRWQEHAARYLDEVVNSLYRATRAQQQEHLVAARQQLSGNGFIQSSPLLLLGDNPATVAHLIPAHHNHELGKISDGELAIGCHLVVPPRVPSGLSVYRKQNDGRWHQVDLDHSICLGHIPRDDEATNPFYAWLVRVAMRCAAAGRFHE